MRNESKCTTVDESKPSSRSLLIFKTSDDSEQISYRVHMTSQNRRFKLELHAKNEKTPSKSYQIYVHRTELRPWHCICYSEFWSRNCRLPSMQQGSRLKSTCYSVLWMLKIHVPRLLLYFLSSIYQLPLNGSY